MIDKIRFIAVQSCKWYLSELFKRRVRKGPVHIFFAMADHYEPGTGGVGANEEMARVDELLEKYPHLVDRHADSEGRKPCRTWFFPPHYHRFGNLNKLVRLCAAGFGEIELHLHHGKHRPDTAENLEATINQCLDEYSEFGIFGGHLGATRYGFIHGDWALDNSRGGKFCGVDNELDVLLRTGCYADFTHPSLPETSPKTRNTIFRAQGVDGMSKSYDSGIQARVGGSTEGLMIVQGPSHPLWISRSPLSLRFLGDVVDGSVPTSSTRVRMWERSAPTVVGKDNVLFIKTHTHGATDAKAVLGDEMHFIFDCLEEKWCSRGNSLLHYVTAREMFNTIRAVESGVWSESAPTAWYDYEVERPEYRENAKLKKGSSALERMVAETYW